MHSSTFLGLCRHEMSGNPNYNLDLTTLTKPGGKSQSYHLPHFETTFHTPSNFQCTGNEIVDHIYLNRKSRPVIESGT
jgi:hypothetical protein